MTPISYIVDTALGFAAAAILGPMIAQQSPLPEIGVDSVLRYGPAGTVIVVVWLFMRDNRARDQQQAEIAKQAAEALSKEREQSTEERKHAMDRVNEISSTFSKTVLDIVARKQ